MTLAVEVGEPARDGNRVRCDVRVNGQRYQVTVSDADAAVLAPGHDTRALVEESFQFLLEREPPESIMRRFDITVIERYFPEYRSDIKRRMAR